jgi:hypothetical protein
LLFSSRKYRKFPKKEEQEICPRNDHVEDAPIRYSVMKGDSIDVSTTYQEEIIFQTQGDDLKLRRRGNGN